MAIPYTRQQLIQRIRKHLNNGFPNDAYATSTNEISLYIDQANAFGLVGMVWMGAKVTGYMEMPEGYLATLQLPALQQDANSGDWFTALPQPPVSLPLGYSIVRVYSTAPNSQGNQDFFMIKANRVGRRTNMPMPGGIRCWVDYTNATILRCAASDNQPLQGIPVFVQMPITRAPDITLPMNLPDDAIDSIFTQVTGWLTKRYQSPKDIINDDLPAGNNTLKS
jgi:hypothetical protein